MKNVTMTSLIALTIAAALMPAHAEPSKESAQTRQSAWQAMTPEEKQAKVQEEHNNAAAKGSQWQALSPEEKQAKAESARAMMQQRRSAR
jgi:mannitol-specific phosphotransferase system IIBC component